MKKTEKKFDSKKVMRIRVIISSILLVLFALGWIIYGLSVVRTNDKTIISKYFKENNLADKINIEFKGDYLNYSFDGKNIGLYKGDNTLYLYGNNKYVDIDSFFKENGLTINEKELFNKDNYRIIIEEIHKIIQEQYKYVTVDAKYLDVSDLYEYNYNFNTSYLIASMSGNKNIMNTLTKMFNCDNKTIVNFLKKYFSDRRFEYTIYTKGRKREIVSYRINIEDIFSYNYKDGIVTGTLNDIIFYKEKDKLLLMRDEWEKEVKINNDVNINFEEYEKVEFDGLYNLIK